jgi:hypothetical protein
MRFCSLVEKWFQFPKNQGKETTRSFTSLLARVFVKAGLVLEPLIPIFVAYFLSNQLRSWQRRGFITNRAVRVERMGRFYYKISVHFVLTAQNLESVLDELIKVR